MLQLRIGHRGATQWDVVDPTRRGNRGGKQMAGGLFNAAGEELDLIGIFGAFVDARRWAMSSAPSRVRFRRGGLGGSWLLDRSSDHRLPWVTGWSCSSISRWEAIPSKRPRGTILDGMYTIDGMVMASVLQG